MLLLKIFALVMVIIMLFTNYQANALPIGGNTTGAISGKYPTLFTPAGFTFSIWGLIYLLLLIFMVLIFVDMNRILTQNQNLVLTLFIVVNLLNILWLLSWHNEKILLSTLIMILLLATLIVMITLIPKSNTFSYATFSVYAGWISVALIANIAIYIVQQDFKFFMNHEKLWFFVALFISLGIGLTMVIKEKNYYYGAVFIWAYIGIASRYI